MKTESEKNMPRFALKALVATVIYGGGITISSISFGVAKEYPFSRFFLCFGSCSSIFSSEKKEGLLVNTGYIQATLAWFCSFGL